MQFSLTTLFMSFLLLFSEFSLAAPVLNADQTAALKGHNDRRIAQGIRALKWDETLQAQAQFYADRLARTGTFQHSGVNGENLYYAFSTSGIATPLTNAVASWMAEESYYHGEVIPQGDFANYGHYSMYPYFLISFWGICVCTQGCVFKS